MDTTILKQRLHYCPDTGKFTWLSVVRQSRIKVGSEAGSVSEKGYVAMSLDIGDGKKRYYAHRLAWLYMTGEWPQHTVDHINRDRADNRWENLREATQQEQRWNSRASGKSGIRGVRWKPSINRWVAYLSTQYLGCYPTLLDAAAARISAEKQIPYLT